MSNTKKIIDLTQTINEQMTVYPGTEKPVIKQSNSIEKDGFSELSLSFSNHTGTHIDAPSHLLPGRKSLDQFPIDKFVGKAMVIRVMGLNEIGLELVKNFESEISNVDFVLFRSAWDKKWNTASYLMDFPTLTEDAAAWLAGFKLKGLGFDYISIDPVSDSLDLPNHRIVLAEDFIIIENLANLDMLPEGSFLFQCLPLKIEDANGSPVRAIAMLE